MTRPVVARAGTRPRVAFIAGLGRSGSTLLDRMLGQVPGCCNIGEASQIWLSLTRGTRCGCGRPSESCPFWVSVLEQVFDDDREAGVAEALRLQRRVDRVRYLPALVAPTVLPRLRRDLERYAEIVSRLYHAVSVTAQAPVIIDSGKHTSTAFLLRHVPDIDLRVVHLVRDPRGVAYSWTKVVKKSHFTDAGDMPRQFPARVARRWVAYNVLLRALRLLGVPTHFVRYEDVVRDPVACLARLAHYLNLPAEAASAPFLSDHVVDLSSEDHTLAGNPMRFLRDPVVVRLDDEWRTRLPARQRRVVTLITSPLLVAYGYLRPRRRGRSRSGAAA